MARRKQAELAAAEAMKLRRTHYQHIRSNRQRRQLLYAFGPILLIVAGLLGYAFYTFEYQRPRQPVARVQGQAISAAVFGQRLQYARRQVLSNVSQLVGMIQSDSSSFITDYANQQRTGVVQSTLDALIDEVLVQKEAEARGIAVSDDEVRDEVCRQLQEATKITSPTDATATAAAASDSPAADADANAPADTAATAGEAVSDTVAAAVDASDAVTATGGLTATGALTAGAATTDVAAAGATGATAPTTDTAAAAPTEAAKAPCTMSDVEFERAFKELYQPALDEAGMTRATYDNIVRMNLFREALGKQLGDAITATAEQVEVQYLVFSDAGAAAGAAALEAAKGGAAWDALVAEYGPRAITDETAGSPSTALTDTVSADGATATFETDPAAATGATTDTGASTAVTDTAAVSDTAATAVPPTAVPLPTAAPEPYAVVKSDAPTWYTKDKMKNELGFIDADVDKVFALAAGKPAEALITGSQGKYVVLVTAKDAARRLDESELQTKRDAALDDWLKTTRTEKSEEINRFPLDVHTPPEPQWYIDGFNQILGTTTGQPTLDVGSMLTVEPAGTAVP